MSHSPTQTPDQPDAEPQLLEAYWRRNKQVMLVLLILWAAVSLGAGVLFADTLNKWNLPGTGYPLGFWFAQQGSVVCFVGIILVYAIVMNRIDAAYIRKIRQAGGNQ